MSRYTFWERVRANIAGFILGKRLWRKIVRELRRIHVGAGPERSEERPSQGEEADVRD